MPFYAQINDLGICYAVTQTHSKVESDKMIELEHYDPLLVGQKYLDGIWTVVETDTVITADPMDTLIENQLILMGALADMYEQMIGGV